MAKVEIYTKSTCPFCVRAIDLLKRKNIDFKHIEVGNDPEKRAKLEEKANGRHTVPQIFINGKGIGGCDELYELEESGKLDKMVG
ncbi:MAG: glutaredoxin 3 [Rickettsiales bacterium]